ncbi:hypothetical protein D3C84_263660 [compost metagenome]
MHADPALGSPLLAGRGAFAKYPGVLAGTTALHRHHFGIGLGRHPGQAAGQHPVAVGTGHRIDPHADRPWLQLPCFGLPDRRLGQLRQFLGDIGVGAGLYTLRQYLALSIVQVATEHGSKAL